MRPVGRRRMAGYGYYTEWTLSEVGGRVDYHGLVDRCSAAAEGEEASHILVYQVVWDFKPLSVLEGFLDTVKRFAERPGIKREDTHRSSILAISLGVIID